MKFNLDKERVILIDWHDNDFFYCMNALGESLSALQNWKPENITKENIAEVVNNLFYGFYLLNQNKFEYGQKSQNDYLRDSYLKIGVDRIYIGAEAIEQIEAIYPNGESLVVVLSNYGYHYNIY